MSSAEFGYLAAKSSRYLICAVGFFSCKHAWYALYSGIVYGCLLSCPWVPLVACGRPNALGTLPRIRQSPALIARPATLRSPFIPTLLAQTLKIDFVLQ